MPPDNITNMKTPFFCIFYPRTKNIRKKLRYLISLLLSNTKHHVENIKIIKNILISNAYPLKFINKHKYRSKNRKIIIIKCSSIKKITWDLIPVQNNINVIPETSNHNEFDWYNVVLIGKGQIYKCKLSEMLHI